MIDAIQQLKNALAYGKFSDEAIKTSAEKLLTELDRELITEDYDPGADVIDAAAVLHDAIEATDSDREEQLAKGSESVDEDDPFAGLGEDEDEI